MSLAIVVPCACCGTLCEPVSAYFDTELGGYVCDDCRKELRNAKAVLAQPCDADGQPIAIRGCYQGADAPDNTRALPPPSDL